MTRAAARGTPAAAAGEVGAARLLRGAVEVSSLPAIYARLTKALDDPRASAAQIADIISEDSGLTARLLRLVNSAFYCFPFEVETVSRAVMIVGTRQISDLALATSVLSLFRGIPEGLVDMESFWLHSIATGVTARIVASHRQESHAERFFVAGVLHDIGRLLIYTRLPDQAREALHRSRRSGEPLIEVEREIIGFDHATAGGALARAWNLPATLEDMVTFHHDPFRASRYPVEAAVVHVADVLAHALRLGTSGERAVPPLDAGAWAALGIPTAGLRALLDQAELQVSGAVQLIRPAGP